MNALEWLNRRIEWYKKTLSGTPQKEIIPQLKKELEMLIGMRNRLQALEIIKEKDVDILLLKNSTCLESYNDYQFKKLWLTQEEYDLLKEVL